MAIKAQYNILVSYKGNLLQMSKTEYLRMVRNEAEHLKLIGKVIPVNKTDIQCKNVEYKKVTLYRKRFTDEHVAQLCNLVNKNLAYLANKSGKNFIKNFYSLVINKMNKSFPVEK